MTREKDRKEHIDACIVENGSMVSLPWNQTQYPCTCQIDWNYRSYLSWRYQRPETRGTMGGKKHKPSKLEHSGQDTKSKLEHSNSGGKIIIHHSARCIKVLTRPITCYLAALLCVWWRLQDRNCVKLDKPFWMFFIARCQNLILHRKEILVRICPRVLVSGVPRGLG